MCWRLSLPWQRSRQTTPQPLVSSISSQTGPSHQNANRYETSYHGGYTNLGYQASGGGTIIIGPQITNSQYSHSSPLDELQKHSSQSAAFDSAARFDPPRCAESTRLRIVHIIEEWINSNGDDSVPSSLFWLYGGAGVGKTAIAQSLSEEFQKKKQLAASFFFFRSDATRNNGDLLIPTLVSDLVTTFNAIVPFVNDRIRENSAIFSRRYQTQIEELLIEPLLALKSKYGEWSAHPRLIVIDGLDECQNPAAQCQLLRVIAHAIRLIPYPLRFFITSRPEAHITNVFDDPVLQAIPVHRYDLGDDPDANIDIRRFLQEEFAEIHRVHRLRQHLHDDWPQQETITSLVERSSRHFIYASTVIRYIRSPKHRPDNRLEIILHLRPPQEGDRPFDQLDALYDLIFAGVESHSQLEKICLVLGILYFQSKKVSFFVTVPVYPNLEELLEMKAGDLVLLLDPILSLISIDGEAVQILHKSLFDYLLNPTRGGHLPFDLAKVHELAANYILKQRIMEGTCDLTYFRHFAYHSQYAYLNDTLKIYLHSLDVPYPKSVMNALKTFPPWGDDLNSSLRSTMWNFFRTLSRKDLNPDGQVYEQYMRKWVAYLKSAEPRRTLPQSRTIRADSSFLSHVPLTGTSQKVKNLKRKLDKIFEEWKPSHLKSMDVRTDDVAFIEEHDAFSLYAEAAFPGNTNTIASSLATGDYFFHYYNFGIWDNHSLGFLTVQTYSRYDDACYHHLQVGHLDFVQETLDYLRMIEKYLFSNLYQKYGLEPDEDILIA